MKTIDDLQVSGQRVLLRLDLNVPMRDGHVTDDGKIKACLPTIDTLLSRHAAIVVISHLGRPGGKPDPACSLAPVSVRLSQYLGRPVTFATDTVGASRRSVYRGGSS
jgi:phosphoglycerate kinase